MTLFNVLMSFQGGELFVQLLREVRRETEFESLSSSIQGALDDLKMRIPFLDS